ncbi:MAG TPA: alpha/beta hydrolase domain-containing protein, partial [Actinomycetota bacterium]
PRFEFAAGTLARDQHGNALGGIRLPPIDVPAARYVSTSCGLGGITVPFTEAELLALYPTHDAYYQPMVARTADAVEAGYLLPEDSADLLARACAMKNRWLEPAGPCV